MIKLVLQLIAVFVGFTLFVYACSVIEPVPPSTVIYSVNTTGISHNSLSDIGTDNHTVIDSHIDATIAHGTSGNIVGLSANNTVDNYISRIVYAKIISDNTTLDTSYFAKFMIPSLLNNYELVDATASVYKVSSGGTPTFGIYNVTDSVNMCSTNITIDVNEYNSYTASIPVVIDAGNDDVQQGDIIRLDCTVNGTGTEGFDIILTFRSE